MRNGDAIFLWIEGAKDMGRLKQFLFVIAVGLAGILFGLNGRVQAGNLLKNDGLEKSTPRTG